VLIYFPTMIGIIRKVESREMQIIH